MEWSQTEPRRLSLQEVFHEKIAPTLRAAFQLECERRGASEWAGTGLAWVEWLASHEGSAMAGQAALSLSAPIAELLDRCRDLPEEPECLGRELMEQLFLAHEQGAHQKLGLRVGISILAWACLTGRAEPCELPSEHLIRSVLASLPVQSRNAASELSRRDEFEAKWVLFQAATNRVPYDDSVEPRLWFPPPVEGRPWVLPWTTVLWPMVLFHVHDTRTAIREICLFIHRPPGAAATNEGGLELEQGRRVVSALMAGLGHGGRRPMHTVRSVSSPRQFVNSAVVVSGRRWSPTARLFSHQGLLTSPGMCCKRWAIPSSRTQGSPAASVNPPLAWAGCWSIGE